MMFFILITMGFFIFTVLLLALRGFALDQMVVMVMVVFKGSSCSLSSLFGLIVVGGLKHRYHLVGRHHHLRQSVNKVFQTLPKALRTQVLTALTSNIGLVGLVQYAWYAKFDLVW